MDEGFDISKAIESVQEMMSTDDGKDTIRGILDMFSSGAENANAESGGGDTPTGAPQSAFNSFDAETFLKLQKVLSMMNSGAGSAQTNFLSAMKPFLTSSRRDKVDKAIKILNAARAVKLLKSIEGGG